MYTYEAFIFFYLKCTFGDGHIVKKSCGTLELAFVMLCSVLHSKLSAHCTPTHRVIAMKTSAQRMMVLSLALTFTQWHFLGVHHSFAREQSGYTIGIHM